MQYVIETKRLCKTYGGRTVVHNLDLHVPQGCVYGFIGPNGAGKSTSMKMLLGLVHPTAGSVALLGRTLTERTRLELLRQTGSLIESPSGYLHLTAQENLEIVADLKGVPYKDIDRVLEIVHLQADRKRKVGQYSLGMKQRLGIAMALLGSPRLLILDEPTNGLDPAGIQEMRALIHDMPDACGATVLISSHLLGEMEQIVSQVGIINHGQLLFEGPLTELQRHSRGNVVLRLLAPDRGAAVLRRYGLTPQPADNGCLLPTMEDARLAALVQDLAAHLGHQPAPELRRLAGDLQVRVHLRGGAGALVGERHGHGGRGGAVAAGVLAAGVDDDLAARGVDLLERSLALVQQGDRAELHLHRAGELVALGAGQRRARHAGRDLLRVDHRRPGHVDRDRDGEVVLHLHVGIPPGRGGVRCG